MSWAFKAKNSFLFLSTVFALHLLRVLFYLKLFNLCKTKKKTFVSSGSTCLTLVDSSISTKVYDGWNKLGLYRKVFLGCGDTSHTAHSYGSVSCTHTHRERLCSAGKLWEEKSEPLVGPAWMHANHGMVCSKIFIVNMILGKNHPNHIIATSDLGALNYKGFKLHCLWDSTNG